MEKKQIMITGATGYVAGWIVKKLLEDGHTVHAPVRDPENKEKTKYLDAIAEKTTGNLVYFKANLLEVGSYDEAMKGCSIVIHTASPFINKIKDAKKDLVDPALKGTENVLSSVNNNESVERVVLTSSCAAIYGNAIDIKEYPNQTMTEAQWNTTSTIDTIPYSYSKVVAERKAWSMHGDQNRWKLVVINPSFVIGPGINPFGTSETFNIIKQLGDGSMKAGAPAFNIGCVDVRDLAIAHVNAAFLPNANGRNIVSGYNSSFIELANLLRPNFGANYPLPKKTMPKWIVWLMAPLAGFKRSFVKNNVGHPWQADNSKGIKELNITYRPLSETINEFFQQMVDNDVFKKK